MTLLKVTNADVNYYGSSFSLTDVNMTLEEGEKVVVYGRDGCGKTTLLRTLAKLEEYTSGDIYVEGKSLKKLCQKELDFGYTFDSSVLSQRDVVADVISYPMRLRDVSQSKIDGYLGKVSGELSLPLDGKVSQLSQLQVAKLIIARLFCVKRRLYLVDDVWKDLPCDEKMQVIDILTRYLEGKSAVIATDDVDVFKALGIDSVIVLSSGSATRQTTYDRLAKRPTNMESAIFCGYELHIGRLERSGERYCADIEGIKYSVVKPISDVFVGKNVCFVIKGEELQESAGKLSVVKDVYYDLQSERIIAICDDNA